jgi:hypothetical protein
MLRYVPENRGQTSSEKPELLLLPKTISQNYYQLTIGDLPVQLSHQIRIQLRGVIACNCYPSLGER